MKQTRFNITFYPKQENEEFISFPTGKMYFGTFDEVIKQWGKQYPEGEIISLIKVRENGKVDY